MAKKKDEFNFDDFDFLGSEFDDFGDGGFKSDDNKSSTRKAITQFTGKFLSGLKDSLFSKENQRKFLRNNLPDGYASAFDAASFTAETVKGVYDEVKDEVADGIDALKPSLKTINKKYGSKLGKNRQNKIDEWTSDRIYRRGRTPTEAESIITEMREGLVDIFGANQAQMSEQSETLTDAILQTGNTQMLNGMAQTKVAVENLNQTGQIASGIAKIVAFQDNVTTKVERKKLELGFRHYSVTRQLLDIQQQTLGVLKEGLTSLVKNTGLPEAVKIHNLEIASDAIKRKMWGTVGVRTSQSLTQIFGEVATNAKKNIRSSINDIMSMASFGMDQFADSLESESFGPEETKAQKYGGYAGKAAGVLAPWLYEKYGGKIQKMLKENPTLLKYGNRFLNMENSGGMLFEKFAKSDNPLLFMASELLGLSKYVYSDNIKVRDSAIQDLDKQALFDVQTQLTINEVIPGFLEKINYSLDVIRTGDNKTSPVRFNMETGRFESVKDISKRVFEKFNNAGLSNSVNDTTSLIIKDLDPDNKLSDEAKLALRKYLIKTAMNVNGKPDLIALVSDDSPISGKVGDEIAEVLGESLGLDYRDFYDRNAFGSSLKNEWTASDTYQVASTKIQGKFNALKNELPEHLGSAIKMSRVGNTDVLAEQGVIKLVDDRWVLDRDNFINRLINPQVFNDNNNNSNSSPNNPRPFNGPGGNSIVNAVTQPQTNNPNTFISLDESYKSELLKTIRDNNSLPLITITNQMLEMIRSHLEAGIVMHGPDGYQTTGSAGDSQKQSWLKKFVWEPGKWLAGKGIDISKWSANLSFKGIKMPFKAAGWLTNKFTSAQSKIQSIRDKGIANTISDIYVAGREKALVTLKDFQENDYYDATTGKIIKTFKDIKGAVVDKDGNFVITEEDFKNGLYTLKEGKAVSILGGAFNAVKNIASGLFSINRASLSGIGSIIKTAYKQAKKWMDDHVDVYLEGESKPRLLWNLLKNGNYVNEDGSPIFKLEDIKGTVYDKMGNVVISIDELRNKLVDKHGNTIEAKSSALKDAIRAAGRFSFDILKKSMKLPFKAVGALYRKFTGGESSLSKIWGSRKHSMDPLAAELLATQADTLVNIYDLLDKRLPKPKNGIFGDHDNDGLREGSRESWLKRMQNRQNDKGDDNNAKDEKDKGSGLLGVLMTIAGGIGGIMGSIKAVGMSIWSSMKTMIALARAKAIADTASSIAGAAGALGGAGGGGKGKAGIFKRALGFMGRHKGKLAAAALAGGLFMMSSSSQAKAGVAEGANAMGEMENSTIKELEKVMSDDNVGAAKTPEDMAVKSASDLAKETAAASISGFAGELGALATMAGIGAIYDKYRQRKNQSTGAGGTISPTPNTARTAGMGWGKQALLMGALGGGGYLLSNQMFGEDKEERSDNIVGDALLWGGGTLAAASLPHFYNRFKEVRAQKAAQAAAGTAAGSTTASAVSNAATTAATKPGILSRIGTGIGKHAGPIGLGLAAYDAYNTEGGALEKSIAFAQSLGTTIVASKAIGAVSGWLGKKAIGQGLRTGAMAALPYLATPMGIAALGAAGVAVGGYFIWKKWFKEDKYLLARFRFAQYGLDIEKEELVQPVAQLEVMASKYIEIKENSNEAQFTKNMPIDQVLTLFGIQLSDKEKVQKFAEWFQFRFRPVFLTHIAITKALTGKASLSNTDEAISKKADKIQYLRIVNAIPATEGVSYTMVTQNPFADGKKPLLDEKKVKEAFEKAMKDVEKVDDDGQKATDISKARAAINENKQSLEANNQIEQANSETQTGPTLWERMKNFGQKAMLATPIGVVATGTVKLYNIAKNAVLNLTGTLNEKYFSIRKLAVAAGEAHPDVLAAQWAIESAWGKKQSGQNNFFGIKAVGDEPGTVVRTREEINGKNIYINAKFKDYASPEEGIRDRVDFMKRNDRYAKHGYFNAKTPSQAIDALVSAGYATDSNYRKALVDIITKRGIDINMSSSDITQLVERQGFKGTTMNESPSSAMANKNNYSSSSSNTTFSSVVNKVWEGAKNIAMAPVNALAQMPGLGPTLATGIVSAGGAIGSVAKGVYNLAQETYEAISGTKDQKKMQLMVYNAFIKAGFSDAQARVLTAEVGRENAYQTKYLFGGHADPKRGHNLGMISWQGARREKLVQFLRQHGALNPNGTIHQSQKGLDAQAAFVMYELKNAPYYSKCGKEFLSNPNIDYKRGNYLIGKFYIVWAYSEAKYASGHKNRDGFYAMLNKQLGALKPSNGKNDAAPAPVTPSNDFKNGAKVMSKAAGGTGASVTVGSEEAAKMGLGTGMRASMSDAVTSAGNKDGWVSRDKAWFDVDAAIDTLRKRGYGLGNLKGLCARFVKYGIDAGDIAGRIPNGPAGHAKDYVNNFKRWGWKELSKTDTVRKGDVAVFPKTATTKGQIYGHIAMYGGDGHWYCDGKQRKERGPYGDPVSQSRNLPYIVFRSPNCYSANPGNVSNSVHSTTPTDAQGEGAMNVSEAAAAGAVAAGFASAGDFKIQYRKDSFIEGHAGEDGEDSGTTNHLVSTAIGSKKLEWTGGNSVGQVNGKTDADKVNAAVDRVQGITVKPTDVNGKTVTAATTAEINKTIAANSAPKFNTTMSKASGETKEANNTTIAIQQVKAELAAQAKPAEDLIKLNQDQLETQKEMLKVLREMNNFLGNKSNVKPTPPKKVPNKVPVSMSKKT